MTAASSSAGHAPSDNLSASYSSLELATKRALDSLATSNPAPTAKRRRKDRKPVKTIAIAEPAKAKVKRKVEEKKETERSSSPLSDLSELDMPFMEDDWNTLEVRESVTVKRYGKQKTIRAGIEWVSFCWFVLDLTRYLKCLCLRSIP